MENHNISKKFNFCNSLMIRGSYPLSKYYHMQSINEYRASNMINTRYGHCGIYKKSYCYVIGGFNGTFGRPMRECERYNMQT
jgi:hypothetical protein